jgi:inactive phospholipase C-like protein 2
VNVDAVCEVRAGKNTDTLRNEAVAGRYSDDCALSIIYGDNFECLDLIASTPEDASVWVTGLTYLVSGRNRGESYTSDT